MQDIRIERSPLKYYTNDINNNTSVRSVLKKQTSISSDCMPSERLHGYDLDNIIGHKSSIIENSIMQSAPVSNDNTNNNLLLNDTALFASSNDIKTNLLMDKQTYDNLVDRNTLYCSDKKKNLNWANYRMPPKQSSGHGFGNPNNYSERYLGIDTRADDKESSRNIDITERSLLPIDTMMINYNGIKHDENIRNGQSTRIYKKSKTDFN